MELRPKRSLSRARRALLRYHASYCAAVGLLECGYNLPSPRAAGGARGLARAPPPIPRALRVPEAVLPALTSAAIEEAEERGGATDDDGDAPMKDAAVVS